MQVGAGLVRPVSGSQKSYMGYLVVHLLCCWEVVTVQKACSSGRYTCVMSSLAIFFSNSFRHKCMASFQVILRRAVRLWQNCESMRRWKWQINFLSSLWCYFLWFGFFFRSFVVVALFWLVFVGNCGFCFVLLRIKSVYPQNRRNWRNCKCCCNLCLEISWAKIITESVVKRKVSVWRWYKKIILTAVTYVIHSHFLPLCIFVVVL